MSAAADRLTAPPGNHHIKWLKQQQATSASFHCGIAHTLI